MLANVVDDVCQEDAAVDLDEVTVEGLTQRLRLVPGTTGQGIKEQAPARHAQVWDGAVCRWWLGERTTVV